MTTESTVGAESGAADRYAALGVIAAEQSRWQQSALVLSEVVGAFAEATLEYEQLLSVISRKLADVVGDLCSVLLLSDDGRTLMAAASYDHSPDVLALVRAKWAGEPLSVLPYQREILDTGEAFLAPHVNPERMRDATTDTGAAFSDEIGMHSLLLVALRAGGRAIGLLALVRHRPEQPPYDDEDRELAQLLANHAAVAIANARRLRRREYELVLAKEAAERANHELEAFSYSVAHDLRAPLRVIDRFANALQSDYSAQLDDDGRHYLGRVQCASDRMTHLIDDLLTLSRVSYGPLHREDVDLTDMARKIMRDLGGRSSGRAVEARVCDGLRATADPGLLKVLLENLLGNAWKFTTHQATATIEVACRAEDRQTVYFVRDNGAGFDMKQAKNLFRPFQRLHTSSEFEGSGVGLATVQRIVGRHGGRVWAESQPDQGTTVFFTVNDTVAEQP